MSKDAYFFSHDSNARTDPKLMALINQYGMEGYGRWWALIEILSEQSNYRLKHCKWSTNALAMAMLCDTNSAESFVNDCISEFELLASDGDHFWSESLNRRMEYKEERRRKKSEAGKKGADKRWNSNTVIAEAKQNDGTAIAEHGKRNETKPKETKQKYMDFVYLTEEEHSKLVEQFGEQTTTHYIQNLNDYIGSKGKKYKSHYHTILTWHRKNEPKSNTPTKEIKFHLGGDT